MSKIMFLPSGFKVEIGSGDVPTDFIEHPYTYIFESLFDSSNAVRLPGFFIWTKIGEVLLESIKYGREFTK